MKIEKFIPCRLGEPLTSIYSSKSALFFGSISGYLGKYDYATKQLTYFANCMNELIRDICVDDSKVYACVGDQYIAIHDENDLNKIEDIGYDDFKHKDMLCGAYFSFISKSEKTNKVVSFLSLFPTSEIEKISTLKSVRKSKRFKTVFSC